jgi:hypothetical protein
LDQNRRLIGKVELTRQWSKDFRPVLTQISDLRFGVSARLKNRISAEKITTASA